MCITELPFPFQVAPETVGAKEAMPMGFTFSFPVEQRSRERVGWAASLSVVNNRVALQIELLYNFELLTSCFTGGA